MSQSQKMQKALYEYVIPNLTAKGFIGKYPHYKKLYEDRIELLVFQTNNLGNSFTVEVSTVFLPESKRDVANLLHEEAETRSIRERLRQKQQQQAQQKQTKKKSRDSWER